MSSAASASLVLKGTHGTSKTRADAIIKEAKFKASAEAVVGPGVYFWAFDQDISLAKRLAANWWRSANDRFKTYTGDDDPSLAILKANIEVDLNDYFDASSEKFLELLIATAENRRIPSTKNDFNSLRVVLLKELQDLQGSDFKVVRAEVDVPGAYKGEAPYVYWAAKKSSYICRDAPCTGMHLRY